MSKSIKKLIAVLTLAGILMTPACSNTDKTNSPRNGEITATATPSSESGTGGQESGSGTSTDNCSTTDKPKESQGTVHVITNDQELEEYFNSISDEEIQNLLNIIESIDITNDVNPDANPGFDQVEIPEEP